MAKPLVSVIIPAHNEAGVIAKNLQAIHNQTYPNWEIIVVDDASTDNTIALAKKYTPLVFARTHAERSVQRNFGASKSKGEYLFFIDADMELTPTVLADCVAAIQADSHIGALALPEKPVANNFLEQVKAFERSFYSAKGDPDTDAARFFFRQAFFEAGGYDETLIGPEDWDLPETISELGYKIGRINTLINHYERVPSLFKLARKKYYYALTSHRYFTKHKLSLVGPKTIYLFRPVFYRNWRKLLSHPILTLGMFLVLTFEQFFGLAGFITGKLKQA